MNRENLKAVSDALHNGAEPGEVWEAIAPRKTCSCGTAWADEPGHDDDQLRESHNELLAACKRLYAIGNEAMNYGSPLSINTEMSIALSEARAAIANAEKSL